MKTAASTAILVSALISSTAAYSYESARLPALYARAESDYDFFPSHLFRRSPVVDKKKGIAKTSGGYAEHNKKTNEIDVFQDPKKLKHSNQGVVDYTKEEHHHPGGRPTSPGEKKKADAEDAAVNRQHHKDPANKGTTKDAIPGRNTQPDNGVRKYGTVPSHENGPQGGLDVSAEALRKAVGASGKRFKPHPDGPQPGSSRGDGPAAGTRGNTNSKREAEAAFWDGYEYALELVSREALAEPIAFADDEMLYEREAEPVAWLEDEFDFHYY